MLNARRQAEDYVRLLPSGHEPPPFVIVCDVGHCFEVYANFRRDGKAFDQFPDRQSFRVYLEDLRHPDVRERLAAIWNDPLTLDPAKRTARVTRAIASRLAAVSKALEDQGHPAEEVAMFIMRCLFTMFAEDVGLLPEKSFKEVLERCEQDPATFRLDVGQLWQAMDEGGYAYAIRKKVPRFNGEFFKERTVLPLGREEIGELRQAASHSWRDVDPSIFGTLLEQALDPVERRRLGAHYTPRAYVERLVVATVIESLRAEWGNALSTAERQKFEGRGRDAIATIATFHGKLCETRVLDPACGTGNFLYVSLELVKRLEGEVLEALADLGGQEALRGLQGHAVDPHQFMGMELNPRAVAIAELVLWIGHLQWHVRTKGGMPSEPILQAFKNIVAMDAVVAPDHSRPRRPEWPNAEFIVGNPPFIGGKDIRARLGDDYVRTLWSAHPHVNESADFVMYWWDRAAELLTRKGTVLRQFGLVTTNSIVQPFQRRVVEKHLHGKPQVSIIMAIPDHPWTKTSADAAAVRIAMTVVAAGAREGTLREVIHEAALDTDEPVIVFAERDGTINSDLTVGIDVTTVVPLKSNEGVCSPGVKLHGAGFIVTPREAAHLGLGRRPGLDAHIREYRNGRDLMARPRGVLVIDLFGLDDNQVKQDFPEIYQHLVLEVKERKDADGKVIGRDANKRGYRRENWWLFGENNPDLRRALNGLPRYVVTVETTKHRVFQFLSCDILPDNMLTAIALADAFTLGVLSSHIHSFWTAAQGGTLEDRPRYTKSQCFDPFPFPAASDLQKQRIRAIAEDLDTHRKRVLADHPRLSLTGIYNVLERLRAGVEPDALGPADRRIFDDGLVLILKELHDGLDAAVADAYGWPVNLSDEDILGRLVALNKERAKEEARGQVRWLRPEYQIPRFGTAKEKAELDLVGGGMTTEGAAAGGPKASFPTDDIAQTAAVMSALATATGPLDTAAVASTFKQGRRVAAKVGAVLAALSRMGFVASSDGGRTFQLRRVA
jgi:hypothetical protein